MKIARRKLMQMSVAAMPVLSMLRAMGQGNAPRAIATGPFQPTWESLSAQYKCPPWFRDAKFGIWAHWTAPGIPDGVKTIAEANAWHEANDRHWNEDPPSQNPSFIENWFFRCKDLEEH
jgi:hypothetical protein